MRSLGTVADGVSAGRKTPDWTWVIQSHRCLCNARALASRLRHAATFLRRCGVAFERFGARGTWVIQMFGVPASEADAKCPADANPGRRLPFPSVATA